MSDKIKIIGIVRDVKQAFTGKDFMLYDVNIEVYKGKKAIGSGNFQITVNFAKHMDELMKLTNRPFPLETILKLVE